MGRNDPYKRLVEELALRRRSVLVIGPAGRTWREDLHMVSTLIADMSVFSPQILHGGLRPFDNRIDDFARWCGLEVVSTPPLDVTPPLPKHATESVQEWEARNAAQRRILRRDPDIFELADLVIALPLEAPPPTSWRGAILPVDPDTQRRYDVASADDDPASLIAVIARGVPVLGIYRYFPAVWFN